MYASQLMAGVPKFVLGPASCPGIGINPVARQWKTTGRAVRLTGCYYAFCSFLSGGNCGPACTFKRPVQLYAGGRRKRDYGYGDYGSLPGQGSSRTPYPDGGLSGTQQTVPGFDRNRLHRFDRTALRESDAHHGRISAKGVLV